MGEFDKAKSSHYIEIRQVKSKLDSVALKIEQAKISGQSGGMPSYLDLGFAISSSSSSNEAEVEVADPILIEENKAGD